jgi:hypothetical protein
MMIRSLTLRVSVVLLPCRNDLNQQAVTLRVTTDSSSIRIGSKQRTRYRSSRNELHDRYPSRAEQMMKTISINQLRKLKSPDIPAKPMIKLTKNKTRTMTETTRPPKHNNLGIKYLGALQEDALLVSAQRSLKPSLKCPKLDSKRETRESDEMLGVGG